MANIGNWIVESCTTIGQGNLVIVGAEIGFARFRDAMPAGDVWYVVEDGSSREAGIGSFNGANEITRTNIHSTLVNGNYDDQNPSPISLGGQSVVACTFNASAYRELYNHVIDNDNPHNVLPGQIAYDSSQDPVSDGNTVEDALFDHSTSIEERVASATGVIEGGFLTGSGTDFNITEGKGIVVDSYTNPENTEIVKVSWPAQSGITLDFGSQVVGSTSIFITASGNILQITNGVSPVTFRENILLGIVYFINGSIIEVTNAPAVIKQTSTNLSDLMRVSAVLRGSEIKPVTSQLQIWTTPGTAFYPGLNWYNEKKNPNFLTIAAQGDETTPISFRTMTQDGVVGVTLNTMPKQYNPSGNTLVNLVGNNACIHRLYSLGAQDATREFILLYGQIEYNDSTVAKSNILVDESLTNFPIDLEEATFIGYLGIGNNASDFDDINEAWIVSAIGGSSSNSGSAVSTDHTSLSNKDALNQHPIESIGVSGGEQLRDSLDDKLSKTTGGNISGDVILDNEVSLSSKLVNNTTLNISKVTASDSILIGDQLAASINIQTLGEVNIIDPSSDNIVTITQEGNVIITGSLITLNSKPIYGGNAAGDASIPMMQVGIDDVVAIGSVSYNSTIQGLNSVKIKAGIIDTVNVTPSGVSIEGKASQSSDGTNNDDLMRKEQIDAIVVHHSTSAAALAASQADGGIGLHTAPEGS